MQASMKAIVQDAYGTAEALRFTDVDVPEPGPDGVLVRVHAASVHAGDVHLTTGLPLLARPVIGLRRPRARVRGTDVAGVVTAVGEQVTAFAPGDAVFGVASGGFAEFAIAPTRLLVRKPDTVSFAQAAAVPTSGCTALDAIRGRVAPGTRVLVTGAGGGVGSFVVALAKAAGAHVTGVCGPRNAERVLANGADAVIDYTRYGLPDGASDVIVELAGNRSVSTLRKALTPRGTLVLAGGESAARWIGPERRALLAILLSPFVGQTLRGLLSVATEAGLRELAERLADGTLTPVLDRACALADTAQAIEHLMAGRARGKVVITVVEDAV